MDLQARRYLELVDQLGEELGKGRGWMSAVAKRLGVHRSTLRKIMIGERQVTASLIERAAETLLLDRSFFSAASGHYTQWLDRDMPARIESEARHAWVASLKAGQNLADEVFRTTSGVGGPELERSLEALLAELRRVPLIAAYESAASLMEGTRRPGKDVMLAAMRLLIALERSLRGLSQ